MSRPLDRGRPSGSGVGALKLFLGVQVQATGATAATLVAAPALIPSQFGVVLPPSAYTIAYLLASAELCFALLSLWALTAGTSERVVFVACASTLYQALFGLAGMMAMLRDGVAGMAPNVGAHAAIVAIFLLLITRERRLRETPPMAQPTLASRRPWKA